MARRVLCACVGRGSESRVCDWRSGGDPERGGARPRVSLCCTLLSADSYCFCLLLLGRVQSSGHFTATLLSYCLTSYARSQAKMEFSNCSSCWGEAPGCDGKADGSGCPWKNEALTNVSAMAKQDGSKVSVEKLLPAKYLRLFPISVINRLMSVHSRPRAGSQIDLSGKDSTVINKAVLNGSTTKEAAVLELSARIEELQKAGGSGAADKCKILAIQIGVVQSLQPKTNASSSLDGAYLFILSKLSKVYCSEQVVSFDMCVEVDDESEDAGEGKSQGPKRFSATLTRPRSSAQMCSLLNAFVLVCSATGLANVLVLGPFLEDVVYEPTRIGSLHWAEAFEQLVIYLRLLENNPEGWRMKDVVARAGGLDKREKEAQAAARVYHPAAFFRGPRGEPRDVKNDTTVTSFNANAKLGCAAWNKDLPHEAKHVHNGRCKFLHKCDQWVTDKGPKGQCHGNHKRPECDYDPAKKCSTASSQ